MKNYQFTFVIGIMILSFAYSCKKDSIVPDAGSNSIIVTDFDKNVYQTILIGKQLWMSENLKTTHYSDGVVIPFVEEKSAWAALGSTDKAYCYYGDSINKDIYGALYTWAGAMNGNTSSDDNPSGVQGVCPTGWHIPSDAEWTELIDFLGGDSIAGGKLKEADTTHWFIPNTDASNVSRFTALPGGHRSINGDFNFLGAYAYFWSSKESNASDAWYQILNYRDSIVNCHSYWKETGFSVRCLRD